MLLSFIWFPLNSLSISSLYMYDILFLSTSYLYLTIKQTKQS